MKINAPQFGDLKTFTVSINSHDITESVAQVSIFQDLLTPFPSCQIDVIDTVNMITKYNLAANANVNIKLGTTQGHDTDSEKSLNFVIHDIGNKVQQNHKAFSYTILCAPREFVNNQNAKVCKSFPQKRPDEIVKSVAQEFLHCTVKDVPPKPEQLKPHTEYIFDGQRNPSKADNQVTYIAPNVSPLTVVANMCKIALMGGKADFVFFNKNGGNEYTFESLSNMWKRKPCVKFVQRPNNIKDNGDFKSNKNLEFQSLAADYFNSIMNLVSGYDANKTLTYDFIKKEFTPQEKSRNGANKIGEPDCTLKFLPKHTDMFQTGEGVFDKGSEWFSSRRNNLYNIEQNNVKIQLTGTPKAFEWLSEIAEIDIPNSDSLSDENLDEKYKGKYMIVAIGHIISRTSYFVNIELANGWSK